MGPAGEDDGRLGPAPSAPGTGLATALPDTSDDTAQAPSGPDPVADPTAYPLADPEPKAIPNPLPVPPVEEADPSAIGRPAETPRWVMALRTAQLAALIVAVLAFFPIGLAEPRLVISYCAPIVLICTALLFIGAAHRDRDQPGLYSAWALFAVAAIGIALTIVLRAAVGGEHLGRAAAAALAACSLVELAAVWLLLRGRSPRWAARS
jgi:hypothetical protein